MTNLSDVVNGIVTAMHGCIVTECFRENTTSLDLTPPDHDGSYCLAAGTHWAFPHVFFKVVHEKDSYLAFTKALLENDMAGPCFPEVYSITQVGDTDKYVVAIERIDTGHVCPLWSRGEHSFGSLIKEASYTLDQGLSENRWLMPDELDMLVQVRWLINRTGAKPDFHKGNFGLKDGLLVCIDPIHNPTWDSVRYSYVASYGGQT